MLKSIIMGIIYIVTGLTLECIFKIKKPVVYAAVFFLMGFLFAKH